jgi:hypothetical protein
MAQGFVNSQNITLPLAVAKGGTGAATAAGARTNLGLAPTIQVFTSGSRTYTAPAGVLYLSVKMVGNGRGGSLQKLISSPNATYAYSVGSAGTAGTIGTGGYAGGSGAAGIIIVKEYYM